MRCAVADLANPLPIHGISFASRGHGVVVTGSSGTGKTGVLLAALARGAALIAAEHVRIDASGTLDGEPEAVRVRPRHRRDLPSAAGLPYRARLAAWTPVDVASAQLARLSPAPSSIPARLRERIRDRAFVDVPAGRFPDAAGRATFETLVLLERDDKVRRAELAPMPAEQAAAQLATLFAGELDTEPTARAQAQADYERLACDRLLGRRLLRAAIPTRGQTRADAHHIAEQVLAGDGR